MIEEPFCAGQSLLHTLDARVKVAWTLGLIVALALTPPDAWQSLGGLGALVVAATILGEFPLRVVLARLRWAWPFLALTLPWLWSVPGQPLVSLPWGTAVTLDGVGRWLSVVWKMSASLWVTALLLLSTPFNLILKSLKSLGVPETLLTVVQLTWRYGFVLGEEAQRLLRARAARSGGALGGRSLRWRAQVTGGMVGNMLVRSLERAERVHAAMTARGFDGTLRTDALPPLRARHLTGVALGYALLFFIVWLGV